MVLIGDKLVDYNPEFRLFLTTRNPQPELPPDVASVITEVNFTTTRAGLEGQLLGVAIKHEKPELEVRLVTVQELLLECCYFLSFVYLPSKFPAALLMKSLKEVFKDDKSLILYLA